MRSRLHSLLVLAALAISAATSSYAAVQSRIANVSSTSRVAIQHTIPVRARNATDLGAAPANRVLDSLSIYFNMTDAQQASLNQLLIDQQNPNSPRYHQWLTPEQFGAQFGLSNQDLAKVTAWLTSQGFTVTGTSSSNTYINFTGTVAQAEQAFGTSIHMLLADGEQHISNISDPTLPAGMAAVVTNISGLHDFRVKPRSHARQVPAAAQADALHPQFTSSLTGSHFIAPGDFYTIYDVNPLLSSSINGTGVKIAVMGQVDISLPDVAAFRSASGLTANPATVQLYGADPGTPSAACLSANPPSTCTPSVGDLDESQLDVEWAGAVAPNASIIFVTSTDVFNTSLLSAITHNVAPIISISYGQCEAGWGASFVAKFNQLFQQANAQGITIVGPSGDSGGTDCDSGTNIAFNGLAVDFPASSPNVTGIGGTMFNEGSATGATSYWSYNPNADVVSSATGYIPEVVWNESGTSGLGAGGGGASIFFSKPNWQTGSGVPNDSARDVPDLALNAASGHDAYLFCSQGWCTNGFRNASSNLDVIGGTSVGTPSFAGILALVQQKINSRIGNANPTIYGLSTVSGVFNDVVSGNNDSPCTAGTPNCPTGGSIGYTATPGYDLASGWGSIDAFNFVSKWSTATPTGTINSSLLTSITTVSTTTSLCANSSGSMALSVSVANGTSNSGGTPTGTVQFFVDNIAVTNGSVTLSNGTASFTLNTSALASGGHTISAVYSGDSTYAASRGALLDPSTSLPAVVDIISSTSADFSISPCSATGSATAGSTSSPVTLTLTPFHGFTGNVTLSTDASSYSNVTAVFTNGGAAVTSVNIPSTAAVPITFTLQAYVTHAKKGAAGRLAGSSNSKPLGKVPWYITGSGVSLACMLLIAVPRRRRWGALLAVVLSVAAIGSVGCGGSNSLSSSGTGGGAGTTTNAAAGTYIITINATSGTIVHTSNVSITVN